jgi:hypothetical protein
MTSDKQNRVVVDPQRSFAHCSVFTPPNRPPIEFRAMGSQLMNCRTPFCCGDWPNNVLKNPEHCLQTKIYIGKLRYQKNELHTLILFILVRHTYLLTELSPS